MGSPFDDGKTRYLGIGDFAASNTPEEVLRTMGLGSCVGIVLLAPNHKAIGLAHIALPSSRTNPTRARTKPGAYADTAIPALIREMQKIGVVSSTQVVAKIAGGAAVVDPHNVFNIGSRNQEMVKRVLNHYNIRIVATELGGSISRNISVFVHNGRVIISSAGKGEWDL